MTGLFGDPWSPGTRVEPDLLHTIPGDQPPSDQDLSEAASVAYVQGLVAGLQPLDSDLTAIAALATTSFGRALLTLADSAALSALVGASGSLADGDYGDIVVSGGGTVFSIDSAVLSAFIRTVLDDPDAATARATLGLIIGTNVQAFDSDLNAIAALATTSFGRSLLTLADAAALRSSAGLVIGTDVQAHDADLDAIAALVTTSFGRSVLTQADATALRALAGAVIGTNVQAWDADLDAIAALATTAFGRSVLTQASASALRTLAGLVIGTDVQAFDSDLASIAALTTTSFGRGLLALADATALRAAAGSVIGTDVQAHDADLDAIAALATTSFGRSFLALADATAGRTLLALAAVASSGSASDLSTGTLPPARLTDYQNGNMEFHLQVSGWFLTTQPIASNTTVAGVADRLQVHPWTPSRDTTIQKIGVEVTTLLAASNAKVVVYDMDPTAGGPNNLLHETGNLSCAAVGVVTEAYAFTFLKGVTYWVGVRTSSTQTLRAYLSTAVRPIGSSTGAGNMASALQKTLTFATGAGAWGAVSSGQLVTPNVLAVVMQLA